MVRIFAWLVILLLFLISVVALIVGLIKPSIVLWFGNKKTRGRVALVYGLSIVLSFILSVAILPPIDEASGHWPAAGPTPSHGDVVRSEPEAKPDPLNENRYSALMAAVRSDAEYGEWLEMQKCVEDFELKPGSLKSLKEWRAFLESLREKEAEWQPLWPIADGIGIRYLDERISMKRPYTKAECEREKRERDRFLHSFQEKIVGTLLFKHATPLDVPLEKIEAVATANGFPVHVSDSFNVARSWEQHYFATEYEVEGGKKRPKGTWVTCDVGPSGAVYCLRLDLYWPTLPWRLAYLKKRGKEKEMHLADAVLRGLISEPPWLDPMLSTVLSDQEKQQVFAERSRLAKLPIQELWEGGCNKPARSLWRHEVLMGDRKIEFLCLEGIAFLDIQTVETAEVWDAYDAFCKTLSP
jgi:hypothetical protein